TKNHKIVERTILIINSTKDKLCPIHTQSSEPTQHMPQEKSHYLSEAAGSRPQKAVGTTWCPTTTDPENR
ncbi:1499_t:CDS:2, partial [Racocetra persica]